MSLLSLLAETAHGAEHGEGAERVFPAFDATYFPSQLFWLFLTFGALYFILSRLILPRMSANLEHRSKTIVDDLDAAARLNDQAEEAKQELEVSLAKARSGALAVAETRIADVRAEALSNVAAVATDATKAIVTKLGLPGATSDAEAAVRNALAGN
jgi:F-type H+-transporting ATPase subunit b